MYFNMNNCPLLHCSSSLWLRGTPFLLKTVLIPKVFIPINQVQPKFKNSIIGLYFLASIMAAVIVLVLIGGLCELFSEPNIWQMMTQSKYAPYKNSKEILRCSGKKKIKDAAKKGQFPLFLKLTGTLHLPWTPWHLTNTLRLTIGCYGHNPDKYLRLLCHYNHPSSSLCLSVCF